MVTVKVKFRPSTVIDRPGAIFILVSHRRIVRQITTEYKVFPDEWNKNSSIPIIISKHERTDIILSIIRKLENDIRCLNRIIDKISRTKPDYSCDDIISEFRRIRRGNSLFIFMEDVIKRLYQLKHAGTAKNYCAALNSFKRFRKSEDIMMETINLAIAEDYQSYLKSIGLSPNSISFYFRILRAVYNRAVELELIKDRRPFRMVFTGTEKTLKRAMSINDIKRIKNLDLSLRPNLEFARDIFLFLFFCRGMSFIDAVFLKKSNVQNGILTYRRHKTGQILYIKIIKPISALIEHYSDKNSTYLLPIITNSNSDERRQYETALRRINNSLKIISSMLKLPFPITTYVSRHTWATIAKSKNIPINVISDALGHESPTTTQIYLASIDTSIIDEANELIIQDL